MIFFLLLTHEIITLNQPSLCGGDSGNVLCSLMLDMAMQLHCVLKPDVNETLRVVLFKCQ